MSRTWDEQRRRFNAPYVNGVIYCLIQNRQRALEESRATEALESAIQYEAWRIGIEPDAIESLMDSLPRTPK